MATNLIYPASLMLFIEPGVQVFATREAASAGYTAKTGKPLPAYDPERPVQLWMETRPTPSGELSGEAGYQYNFIAPDSEGYYRMDPPEGVPYALACVPNIQEAGLPGAGLTTVQMQLFPIRKLGVSSDGSYEVLASSPFGVEIVTVNQVLNGETGMLNVPPDVLAAIQAETYLPPGV